METPPPIAFLPRISTNPLDAITAENLQHALNGLVTLAGGTPDAIASVVTTTGQWSGAAGISRSSTFLPDLAYGVHGSQVGYSAFLAILPVRQIVVAVFVNDSEANVEQAARRLVNALGT